METVVRGDIAWRCVAPGTVSAVDPLAREGLLILRALHGASPRADIAFRAP